MRKTTRRLSSRSAVSSFMILLIIFSMYAPLFPLAKAQTTEISLDPVLIENLLPGDTYDLNIMITGAENVYAWEFTISFAPFLEILEVTLVTEGSFLQGGGEPTYISSNIQNVQGWVKVGCTIVTPGASGVSGAGFLATLTFRVAGGGQTTLDLHDTSLVDPDRFPIEHTVGPDGFFRGKAPYTSFNYSPRPDAEGYAPAFNTTVTFDASQSYDPNGGTVDEYFWDFADGTTGSVTTPVTTHVYVRPPPDAQSGEYDVNLTITDNEGHRDWASKTVRVYIRDLAITDMIVGPTGQIKWGTIVSINVTVENLGSGDENLTVTTFYDDNVISSQYIPYIVARPDVPPWFNIQNLTFTWNTTDVPAATYAIKAVGYTNPGENNITNNELVWGTISISDISILTYSIPVYGVTFEVGVRTNSIISAFTFDYPNRQFLFNVYGPPGHKGNCTIAIPQKMLNATIPPELLNTTINAPIEGAWNVMLNGLFTPYRPTRNDTYYFLHFNFTFASVYEVRVIGTDVPTPPQPILTMSSTMALVDELVTFDASQSYDPEGGTIISYYWRVSRYDRGTGMYITIWDHTTSNPTDTFSHNESAFGQDPLLVEVAVTTDLGFSNSTPTQELEIFAPYELAIVGVTVSATTLNMRQIAHFNVTVRSALDLHGYALTFRLRIYGNDTILAEDECIVTPSLTIIESLDWNTTDYSVGVYSIKANITATVYGGVSNFPTEVDVSDNEMTFGNVRLKKWDSRVSLVATPTSINIGSSVSLLGSVTQATQGINVTLQFQRGAEAWTNITRMQTNQNGEYFYTWTPAQLGVYQLKAVSHGNATISMNASSTFQVTVNAIVTSISVSASPESAAIGAEITISGSITPVLAQLTVKLYYRKVGEATWIQLPTSPALTTDSQGRYSYVWEAAEAGTYEFQARWDGNTNTLASQDTSEPITIRAEGIPSLYIYAAAAAILVVAVLAVVLFLRKRKP